VATIRAMNTSTSPRTGPATLVECPWCDGGLELEPGVAEIECPDCRIRVEVAPARPTGRRPVLAAA
jgi:hypothetical protein